MFYTSGKVSTIYSVVLADDVFQFFMKYSYVRVLLIHGGAVKKHLATGHSSTKKSNSNNLEPPFPATKSRSLRTREDTKTAVASPHCNESTRNSIPGWSTLLMEVTPELWRSYGTSYVRKKNGGRGVSSRVFVGKIGFSDFFYKKLKSVSCEYDRLNG